MNKTFASITCFTVSAFAFASVPAIAGASSTGPELLTNAGFEGSYSPVPVEGGASIITGVMAEGWTDSSTSSSVKVKYQETRDNVHGGLSAQVISVGGVGSGFVELGQNVSGLLEGHHYSATIWARGDGRAEVAVGLANTAASVEAIGEQESSPSADWQKLTIDISPTADCSAFFYVKLKTTGTVTIDDASLVEESTKK